MICEISLTPILVAVIVIILVYLKLTKNADYWKKIGVPEIPNAFPIRNLIQRKVPISVQIWKNYNYIKENGWKHGGALIISSPLYIPRDPEIIKIILQKDFKNFSSHGTFVDEINDPLTGNLFNLEGSKWRNLRIKLTPTFTSGKMKMMFETFVYCTNGLKDIVDQHASIGQPIDVKDILGRFTTDIIGNAAFGIECNSMKEPDNDFRVYGKKSFERTPMQIFKLTLLNVIPPSVLHYCGFKFTDNETESFFMKIVKDTVEYREKNKISRPDFMQLLLELKNKGRVSDDNEESSSPKEIPVGNNVALTIEELAAQCFVFFTAGFETSSTAMTFALYELSINREIQTRAREEINLIYKKHGNKFTYDGLKEMKYLEQIIQETLRKYPPIPALPRKCIEDIVLPGTNAPIKKGTRVFIATLGMHRDPDFFPDPEKFDPERFSDENRSKINPMTFLPFGEGPRMCIGLRFGLLQAKVGLASILKDYEVTLNSKTQEPIEISSETFIYTAKGGIWLDAKKVSE